VLRLERVAAWRHREAGVGVRVVHVAVHARLQLEERRAVRLRRVVSVVDMRRGLRAAEAGHAVGHAVAHADERGPPVAHHEGRSGHASAEGVEERHPELRVRARVRLAQRVVVGVLRLELLEVLVGLRVDGRAVERLALGQRDGVVGEAQRLEPRHRERTRRLVVEHLQRELRVDEERARRKRGALEELAPVG